MKNLFKFTLIIIAIVFISFSCKNDLDSADKKLLEEAYDICERNLILDSHIDWPSRLLKHPDNISQEIKKGDFDLVRSKKGGLNATLSVIFASPEYEVDENRAFVDSQINLVVNYAKQYADQFALAKNPEDIVKNFKQNLFSIPLCLENGAAIGDDIEYLKYLKDKGFAYITLSHAKTNQICDANFDTTRTWNGLSPFGFEVIKEMNQLGASC